MIATSNNSDAISKANMYMPVLRSKSRPAIFCVLSRLAIEHSSVSEEIFAFGKDRDEQAA